MPEEDQRMLCNASSSEVTDDACYKPHQSNEFSPCSSSFLQPPRIIGNFSCSQEGDPYHPYKRKSFFDTSIRGSFPDKKTIGSLNVLSAGYESLDYDTCINSLWVDEERKKGYSFTLRKALARWWIVIIIGSTTALLACAIDISIDILSGYKYRWLTSFTNKCSTEKCMIIPYFLWVALNVGPTILAVIMGAFIEPVSAGSGIPLVKCYLNGVKVPRIVRIKTLFCKCVGVIMSVLGGLAVGKEGPMIHSGAVIAAGLSQGKSTSLNADLHIFEYFREDREKRDFVSAGAAAGVASAFGAPVGGVLFSLEEGASFWNQNLTWRVFFGAMVACFTLNLGLSAYNGVVGQLNYPGLLNFGKFNNLVYEIWEFFPFLLMGIIGGLLGAFYNHINYKLAVFRMRYIRNSWLKLLEAVFVALVTATAGFLMTFTLIDCRKATSGKFPQMYCESGEESVPAVMWFQTPEATLRSLFHDHPDSYNVSTLGIYCFVYFVLHACTYGLGIPSGLFIPTLVTGAAWGRLVGILLHYLFPDQDWADEGKYALVGAAAMLGGVVRMTLSLTVILMECVGNITFGLPLTIVLMTAKWVGDYFNEGLYDIYIQMAGVPIMAWEPPPLSNTIHATVVMNRPVTTLLEIETVRKVYEILVNCTHNGFPVVDSHSETDCNVNFPTYGKLLGLINRSQLVVLLKYRVFNENYQIWHDEKVDINLFRSEYPRYQDVDSVDLSDDDLECTIDLRPFMNPSPYSVVFNTSLPRVFHLFRSLGLRHLVIVNKTNDVIGMVTRKDLVKFRVWKHRGQTGLQQLGIYKQI